MSLDKKRVRKPIEKLLRQLARFILAGRFWGQTMDNNGEFVTGKTTDY